MTRPPNVLLVWQDQLRYDVVADDRLCATPAPSTGCVGSTDDPLRLWAVNTLA